MKRGYNIFYLQKDIDNEVDSKTIFFTENKKFAIDYITKYNVILNRWKDYFDNNDVQNHQLDRRNIINSIIGCYYEEVPIRGEITMILKEINLNL